MRALIWLVALLAAVDVHAAAAAPWPRESADAFVAGCRQSMGASTRHFGEACNCFLKRAQSLWTPEELDTAVSKGDPVVARKLEKQMFQCLDADPAGYERMLRFQEQALCVDKGESRVACACMTRQMKARWPRPSSFWAFSTSGTEAERKAERRKLALACRAEASAPAAPNSRTSLAVAPPAALTSFRTGARTKFSSKGHSKANGIHLTFEYPAMWIGKEGERPHVVHKASGMDEAGFPVVIVLVIKEAPPEIRSLIEVAGVDAVAEELFSDEVLKEAAKAEGGTLLESGRTRLEGQPASWFMSAHTADRAGVRTEAKVMTFQTIYRESLLHLQLSVAAPPGKSNALAERFDAYVPLFRLIANSLVFQDRY